MTFMNQGKRNKPRRGVIYRPALEALEDRCLLAAALALDINPVLSTPGTTLEQLTNINGTLFFAAGRPNPDPGRDPLGVELWKSDGTEAGTVLVKDIVPGSRGSSPDQLTNVNGTLFFRATIPGIGTQLWKSDGTADGTVVVLRGVAGSGPYQLTHVNGTLFFARFLTSTGAELWKSDGTQAGTVLVKDINPGAASSDPFLLTNVNGTLFFRATTPGTGTELWKSDGTADGTVLVKDITPGSAHSAFSALTNVNGTLFFAAGIEPFQADMELWKSDGKE